MELPRTPTPYERPDSERPASAAPTEQQLEQQTPGGHGSKDHDPYAAMRFPGYRRYMIGSVLLSIGQLLQSTAVGWEAAKRSANPALALSFVGLVGAVPVILLALPAGYLADRVDRKRLTILTLMLGVICSLGLATVSYHQGSINYMYGLLLVGATASALGGPARSSLLPQVVPVEVFSNAMTWNSILFQIASAGGPALAGWIIGIESVRMGRVMVPTLPLAYVLDAFCAVAFGTLLLFVTLRPAEGKRREPANLKTLVAGIHFVGRNQIILATISLDLFAVLLGGATYLLPIYADKILHVGAQGFGWLRAAPAFGALTMGMLIAHLPPMKHAGRNLLLAVIGFGLATIVFGLSTSFWLSMGMLFLTGSFDNISVVVRHTLVQVLTPDDMRGRVSAVNNVFIGASNELGGWESGLTAQLFGVKASVVGGGIGTLLVVLATALTWPALRRFGSLHDARPIEQPEAVVVAK